VIALFPFGLVQPLRYLSSEDVWQTRFLAPTDMQDGTYTVRLILRDQVGHTYRESKTFVIASKPPVVQVKLDKKRYQRGQTIDLKVSASANTRTLVARMEDAGAIPVALRWDARAAASTGSLTIPEQTIPGTYKLTVTAEDIAHNIATQEVPIEVLP
jgi:Ca-activated chloride channel family protein